MPPGDRGRLLGDELIAYIATHSARNPAHVDALIEACRGLSDADEASVAPWKESLRRVPEQLRVQAQIKRAGTPAAPRNGADGQLTGVHDRLLSGEWLTSQAHATIRDLERQIGRIRAEEAMWRQEIPDLTAGDIDTLIAQMLLVTSCDEHRDMAYLIEHYFYYHGRLSEEWIDELITAACEGGCPDASLLAGLIARDVVVREDALRSLLFGCDTGRSPASSMLQSIIDGLKLSRAPVSDRLRFAGTLVANPPYLLSRDVDVLESLQAYLRLSASFDPIRSAERDDANVPNQSNKR